MFAYRLTVKMKSFETLGLSQNGIVPRIIKSKLKTFKDDSAVFLDVYFETNPNENYDQKLHITLRPLKVVYDAQTFLKILEILTPEKDIPTVKNQSVFILVIRFLNFLPLFTNFFLQ